MTDSYDQEKNLIIQAIVAEVEGRLEASQARLCGDFVKQFFFNVSLEDLKESTIGDLSALVLNFWTEMLDRQPNQSKINLYNPSIEHNGWHSQHTILELICNDMPFLVDSLRIILKRMGLSIYLTIHMGGIRLLRDSSGHIKEIIARDAESPFETMVEAPILMKIERVTDEKVMAEIKKHIHQVLEENRAVVDDWSVMRERIRDLIQELIHVPKSIDGDEIEETKAFLNWIEDHHFTFIGMRDYQLTHENGEAIFKPLVETGYGVLRQAFDSNSEFNHAANAPLVKEQMLSSQIFSVSKTDAPCSIHRDVYTDYIAIKRFNDKGELTGERRVLGLYTSAAYNSNPTQIPFLRHKVAFIIEQSKLNARSHAGRILLNILETLPRDDLIQGSVSELLRISMGIFYMQERRRIRMFTRMDIYHRFLSCLVFVPKDVYNSDLRIQMQQILTEAFGASSATFSTYFTESVMARIHFVLRINPNKSIDFDYSAIESKLVEIGRSWSDDLSQLLIESKGDDQAREIFKRYKTAFPAVYKASFSPKTALMDIKHIDELSANNPLSISFYRDLNTENPIYRLKLYQNSNTLPLSDILPIIENMGLRAISERPYLLNFSDRDSTWINDFSVEYVQQESFNLDDIQQIFQKAIASIWFGETENDGFNKLILACGLECRQVAMLRSYAKYFKQIGLTFSQEYIEGALLAHPEITRKLFELFELRFAPDQGSNALDAFDALKKSILNDLASVSNLDEDKIIRQYINVISETLRTNYYQTDAAGQVKPYISIKLNSKAILGLPKPWPLYEIFVYSPDFEAIHLRSGMVARGGLRWSDRREDFRTEVLGLMKAQQVKNAVIVPNGAKGGFVVKRAPAENASREEILAKGIACYQQFIRGLLDITDNYINSEINKPNDVVCYDGDDAYLVVAADKGTATFSDIANAISLENKFWLGDAFASGGSVGYDHKKIGITARGAWESVQRHGYALGIDVHSQDFTVVGIGDMAGDVFGNGMLLSHHIRLVAAFNHLHIFVDPNPDAQISFEERKRLFNLPRSSWLDYNPELISKGGGVFSRSAKSIALSPEMKSIFGLKEDSIEPNDLLKAILKAKVDLLWSAGIGTFVKARDESNADVGDRTNDLIRVNAKQIRARSVVEGGNLGFTQLGRIEYALNKGLIYTDFIDNSAGVSCSDKEVNIKILLNLVMNKGELVQAQRNTLLSDMTDEVAQLVLRENYLQTRSINLSVAMSYTSMELHLRYMNELQRAGKLDRHIEFLPDDKHLQERKAQGLGLTSSEVAVLMCYTKILLKEAILDSDLPEDAYLNTLLIQSFPKPLQEKYAETMREHPLKRELIATKLSNLIINEMGFGFIYRIQTETGALVPEIVRAFIIARAVFQMDEFWNNIEALDNQIKAEDQMNVMIVSVHALRRATRWFLKTKREHLDLAKNIGFYQPKVAELRQALPACLSQDYQARFNERRDNYTVQGIHGIFAAELSKIRWLFAAMDIVDIGFETSQTIKDAAEAFFGIGAFLDLGWLREQIMTQISENHWEVLANEELRDDLDKKQRLISIHLLSSKAKNETFMEHIQIWAAQNIVQMKRWSEMMKTFKTTEKLNTTMFFVAVREFFSFNGVS